MTEKNIAIIILAVVALGMTAGIIWWIGLAPEMDVPMRVVGEYESEEASGETASKVAIGVDFVQYDGQPSSLPGAWPSFRGENVDNIVGSEVKLIDGWDEGGPPVLWRVSLGEGHAGPAVMNGRVYVMDYDEENFADSLRCFSLDDGKEIWRRSYEIKVKRNHGMSRTVPAVDGTYVITMGPKCHVMCVDAKNGDLIWAKDLVSEYGSTIPLWYTGQCPLIDQGQAILAPAGSSAMIGVDLATGEVVWETPNPGKWKMSHSSVIPMTLQGKRMYVYCSIGATFGVSAEGDDRGKMLWSTKEWSGSVISPSPVPISDTKVFLTAGYGEGSMMLKINRDGDQYSVETVYRLERSIFGCEQQTPIFYQGHIFGVLPKDAGALRAQFVCMDPKGELVWTSGKTDRFGLGPFLAADDKMFILDDYGTLTLVRASTSSYQKLAQTKLMDGHDAWAPMAMAEGRLLLRDARTMMCLDVRAM